MTRGSPPIYREIQERLAVVKRVVIRVSFIELWRRDRVQGRKHSLYEQANVESPFKSEFIPPRKRDSATAFPIPRSVQRASIPRFAGRRRARLIPQSPWSPHHKTAGTT